MKWVDHVVLNNYPSLNTEHVKDCLLTSVVLLVLQGAYVQWGKACIYYLPLVPQDNGNGHIFLSKVSELYVLCMYCINYSFFFFFPESGLLCSREPRTCITRSWDLSWPDTKRTLIATLMNWGPELVTWPFSGGSEDQFMLKPASLSFYSMLRHSLTDPNNLPFHLPLWHPSQIWPLLNALLLKVLQRVPHRCVFFYLLSAPRLAIYYFCIWIESEAIWMMLWGS